MKRSKNVLLFVLLFFVTTTVSAIPKDVCDLMVAYGLNIDRIVDSISINNRDVSIEVETPLYDNVLKILTTTDGTIRPLFHTPTQSVTKWLFDAKLTGEIVTPDPLDISWDMLSGYQKASLLKYVSRNRNIDFFDDRQFHGLRIRPVLSMYFDKPTVFLGKQYQEGLHEVDVSHVLSGKVEYLGPLNVQDASGIEFHFRGPYAAGSLSRDLRTLQTAINIPQSHQHVHIVADLPMTHLRNDPTGVAAELTNHWLLTNYVAEMTTITVLGSSISRTAQGNIVYFDNLNTQRVAQVARYFTTMGEGQSTTLGDIVKMGWVGFRGHDKYDQPNLFGYEYRAIPTFVNTGDIEAILNATQYYMRNYPNVTTHESFLRWWQTVKNQGPADQIMQKLWYQRPWDDLFNTAHADIKPLFDHNTAYKFRSRGEDTQKELKMLVHDWTTHPLIYDNLSLQQKILAAQKSGIQAIKIDDSMPAQPVVKKFLMDSGLFDLFKKQLSGG